MTDSLYGIFGGTFDPVHNGHIETAREVSKHCRLRQILFIPSAAPPHKNRPRATARQRLEMVALAIAGHPQFDVDDRDLRRDDPSYAFDTVESLQADFPQRKYCFIIGVDAIVGLESWYRWQELRRRVHFIVMARPGWRPPNSLPQWWRNGRVSRIDELSDADGGKIYEIPITPVPVSATEIRSGISRNADVSGMMPAAVWEYIICHNLYQSRRQAL